MAVKVFNDQSNPQAQMPPTQTSVLKQAFKDYSQQLRVCLPGKIVTYDYKLQQATVQPTFSNEYNDGTVQQMPSIYNVPVVWPSAGESHIHFPLNVGDPVLLIFADKSLDLWLQSGTTSQPNDSRTHHIADAIAIPGCRPFNNPMRVSNGQDVIVANGNLELRLKPNGHVQLFRNLNNQNSLEMISLINQFMYSVVTDNMGGAARAQNKFKNFVEQ